MITWRERVFRWLSLSKVGFGEIGVGRRYCPTARALQVVAMLPTMLLLATLLHSSTASASALTIHGSLAIGTWSPHGSRWQARTTACAWTADQSVVYRIMAASQSATRHFALTNGAEESVRYAVFWRNRHDRSGWDRLHDQIVSDNVYVFARRPHCTDGVLAEIRIIVNKADVDAAMPGVYSDKLLLTLVPM